MRTEVKIASVIVLVALVICLVWWVGPYRKAVSGDAAKLSEGGEAAKVGTEGGEENVVVEGVGDTTTPPAGEGTGVAETPAESPGDPDTVEVGMAERDSPGTTEQAPAPTGAGRGSESVRPWWERREYPSRVTVRETTTERQETGGPTSETPTPTSYVIKDGDSYWSIAKARYGDATLYRLLEKANPNIPARSLRKGMSIKVPPRPVVDEQTPADSGAATASHGTTETDPVTGERFYIVKKGDNGFWGISKAVFGAGKHWKQIGQLNPGVNSAALRAGQKIRVPKTIETAAVRDEERVDDTSVPPAVADRTAIAETASVRTGAPVKTVLPSGEVFD